MIMGIFVCANCDSLICSNRVYPIGTFLKAGSRCCDSVRTTLIIARLASAQAEQLLPANAPDECKIPKNWELWRSDSAHAGDS